MKMFKRGKIQEKLVIVKIINLLAAIESQILVKIRLKLIVFLHLESGELKNGSVENEALKPYLMWINSLLKRVSKLTEEAPEPCNKVCTYIPAL